MTSKPKIALATGHANTNAGGHPGERALVAPIVRACGRRLLELGADVRYITPQEGMGSFPDGLQAVARQINVYNLQGWRADVFLEIHAEGNSQGDRARGSFAIYPNKLGDVDAYVRDTLGPAMAAALQLATGIPARTAGVVKPGVMAETQTGVGEVPNKRLGAFIGSYASRKFCTRLLYEVGSMTSPKDMKIMQAADFQEKAGRALAEAIAVQYGLTIPAPKPAAPAQAPATPNAPLAAAVAALEARLDGGTLELFVAPRTGTTTHTGVRMRSAPLLQAPAILHTLTERGTHVAITARYTGGEAHNGSNVWYLTSGGAFLHSAFVEVPQ